MSPVLADGRRDVVVVGGGIAGLAAAHRLLTAPGERPPRITLLEASERVGGKIRTEPFAGRGLDVGAEALLARVPAGAELCAELGLRESLVEPAGEGAFVWSDRLRPLPPRLLAGSPGGTRAVLASRVLSPAGLLRAGVDLVVPSSAPEEDVSIGSVVRRRAGSQVLERFIDPLLGGIHAGSCDELSMRAVAPQFEVALKKRRGLVRGLRAMSAGHTAAGPVFLGVQGGLERVTDALRRSLEPIDLRTASPVRAVEPLEGGGALVRLADGSALQAREVILAVPAADAGPMVAAACPQAAAELAGVSYASVATIALAYEPGAITRPLDGTGFLATKAAGRTITACTWSSAKWAHLAGETTILKCSVGHTGDRSALDLHDEQLLAAVRADLRRAMGLSAEPLEWRVFRFERALPQYTVGHLERIARLEAEMARLPGVRLCGASYHGVGVASCIKDGRAAADAALEGLRSRGGASREGQAAAPLALSAKAEA